MDRLVNIQNKINQIIKDSEHEEKNLIWHSASRIFFRLALKYDDLGDFCRLVVSIPKMLLDWDASVYLSNNDEKSFLYATTRLEDLARVNQGEKINLTLLSENISENGVHFFPLISASDRTPNDNDDGPAKIVGAMVLFCGRDLKDREIILINRYADLVAQSVVHRLLIQKTNQHLNFIKKLVADLGHNVILPNIVFKAYLRRLYGKISRLTEIQEHLININRDLPPQTSALIRDLAEEMANANEGILEEFGHIQNHYVNTSLFLETLLRQSHFEKGRYVLKKKACNFRQDIIRPLMEQYLPKLKNRNIEVDLSLGGVPDKAIEAVVDRGLVSQVFGNLLSNAVKYTRLPPGEPAAGKFIAYGLEFMSDAFGDRKDGLKINLFSTGPNISAEDAATIFEEGKRGSNVESERGTGHGLFFVKEVIELHGGKVGYEPMSMGNNFYFILPL